VVAIFQPDKPDARSYPLYKGSRVYRSGSQAGIQERTLERMREAYARCNQWVKEHK
jgi:hypothetical protein